MPHDISIKATNDGTIDAEYSVIASPKRDDVTAEELAALKGLKPIDEVVSGTYGFTRWRSSRAGGMSPCDNCAKHGLVPGGCECQSRRQIEEQIY